MGFLDNSGDIILDAVLTDHGRKQLAKGDGTSFQIQKFALGDEEVDYSLYDVTNTNGSAYYDLEILQTPILEAFTDNAISMQSKLMTIENLELLYLPVLRLNNSYSDSKLHSSGSYVIAVDEQTEGSSNNNEKSGVAKNSVGSVDGILTGFKPQGGGYVHVDQGLHTTAIPPSAPDGLPEDLKESAYTIQIDSRLGKIASISGASLSDDYIDDDNVAYYTATLEGSNSIVEVNTDQDYPGLNQVIDGPRGSMLKFKIKSTENLIQSTYLFEQLGSTSNLSNEGGGVTQVYHIDSLLRVTGINTGYTLDIPIRFVKFKSKLS